MGTTPAHNLPYPEPTDPVAQGAAAIRSLAESVDPKLGRFGSWTPTLTNIAIGTGGGAAAAGNYVYYPGLLVVDIAVVLGSSGFSVTGGPIIGLPAGFVCGRISTSIVAALGVALISGGGYVEGVANHSAAAQLTILAKGASTTYVSRNAISATVPGTWVGGDGIFINGIVKGILP